MGSWGVCEIKNKAPFWVYSLMKLSMLKKINLKGEYAECLNTYKEVIS